MHTQEHAYSCALAHVTYTDVLYMFGMQSLALLLCGADLLVVLGLKNKANLL